MLEMSDNIEAIWEICEDKRSTDWPFMLICHRVKCADMWFPCKTLEEAHAKLVAIAVNADKDGFKLGLG
jgi:hypothetical protein